MYTLSITLYSLGDLGEMSAKGSLHEYLIHLHDEGHCPVTSFWWGKEHVVSVCSPQAFKDTVRLTDKAGEREREEGNTGITFLSPPSRPAVPCVCSNVWLQIHSILQRH